MSTEFKRNQYLIIGAIGLGVFYMWTQYKPPTSEEIETRQKKKDDERLAQICKEIIALQRRLGEISNDSKRPDLYDFHTNLPHMNTACVSLMGERESMFKRWNPLEKGGFSADDTYGQLQAILGGIVEQQSKNVTRSEERR